MAWTEIHERGHYESANNSGRRVTEKIKRVKEMIEDILDAAEEMEEQYGERDDYDREGYGERNRMRDSRGRYTSRY